MNTQENNKLIAEFMGFTSEKNIGWYDNNMMMPQNVYDTQNGNCFDELLFDQSWDWLMPIVSKCRKESNAEDSHWESVYYSLEGCDIDVTYQAVVEFIKWYNEQEDGNVMTLKDRIITRLKELGANIDDFKFKYYKESPYQKKRYKPEFVESECWIYPKGKKEGYVITEEDFNYVTYSDPYLQMIVAESKL
jgi:hypothetical protein